MANAFLFLAAIQGDLGAFKSVDKSLLKEMRGPGHQTLLHVSAITGHESIVRWLLDVAKVDANSWDQHRRTPLHLAALTGSLPVIQRLLSHKSTDKNAVDGKKRTALHTAASNGHLQVVEYLVKEYGLLVSPTDHRSRTPLHLAALKGFTNVVRYLASRCSSVNDLNQPDYLGFNFFQLAAWQGHANLSQEMLPWIELICENETNRFIISNLERYTPMHLASHAGHFSVALALLDASTALIEAMGGPTKSTSQTPLHMAAAHGSPEMINLLLSRSVCEQNYQDVVGRIALHYAARNGHEEATLLLIQCSNVHQEDMCGYTALHLAAAYGHLDIVKSLIKAGANPELGAMPGTSIPAFNKFLSSLRILDFETTTELPGPLIMDSTFSCLEGATPLQLAQSNGHNHVVKHLLDHFSSSTSQDPIKPSNVLDCSLSAPSRSHGVAFEVSFETWLQEKVERRKAEQIESEYSDDYSTDFHLAAEVGNAKFIEDRLASRGVEVNMRDGTGNTMLHIASKLGRTSVVKLLLSQPTIDVNARDGCGMTALHLASQEAEIATLKLLLDHPSVDVMAKNDDKHSALVLAYDKRHWQVCKTLIDSQKCDRADFPWLLRSSVECDEFNMAALLAHKEGIGTMQEGSKKGLSALDLATKTPNRNKFACLLMGREDVQRTLLEKKRSFMDLANAILVGAALIASIAYQGWVNPPPHLLQDATSTLLYWWLDGFSFYLGISTVVAAAVAALPSAQYTELLNDVQKARRFTIAACLLLVGSVLCVMGAFGSAGYMGLVSNTTAVKVLSGVCGALCCTLLLALIIYLARLVRPQTLSQKLLRDRPPHHKLSDPHPHPHPHPGSNKSTTISQDNKNHKSKPAIQQAFDFTPHPSEGTTDSILDEIIMISR